jgi:hypothetical protein
MDSKKAPLKGAYNLIQLEINQKHFPCAVS